MIAQHIEELDSPPVVGRRYWVPCVRVKGSLWPVIGPPHGDADLGVPEVHLHHDCRFMSERQVQQNLSTILAVAATLPELWFKEAQGVTLEQVLELARHSPLAAALAVTLALPVEGLRGAPTPHLRVCKREVAVAPPGWFLPMLEQQHATVRAPDCRSCPHRGTPLRGLPVDAEGGVVCPAHGLRWSKATGRLMPRACPSNLATPAAASQYREALRGGRV
jgi:hypothetical protein